MYYYQTITFIYKTFLNSIKTYFKALTSSLSNGYASFCTMRFVTAGENVPCHSILNQNYQYSYLQPYNSYYKNYDYAFAGYLCSISKRNDCYKGLKYFNYFFFKDNAASISYTKTWDDDSINIELTTITTPNAVGTYSLTFTAYNGVINASFVPQTYTWTVLPNLNSPDNFTVITIAIKRLKIINKFSIFF